MCCVTSRSHSSIIWEHAANKRLRADLVTTMDAFNAKVAKDPHEHRFLLEKGEALANAIATTGGERHKGERMTPFHVLA
uniref:Uncharacterized protein n=1 Tax=Globodera rostochiensis TaxID=31243 RepID=A0A914HX12_GLORO